MKVFDGSKAAEGRLKSSVVTLGVFDGVHLGHQALLKKCRQLASRAKIKAVAYTFNPHPVRILFPEACPPLITTKEQKLSLIADCKMDVCVVEPFTKKFSHIQPEAFFKRILVERLQAQKVVVGYDFTFGEERRGTIETLRELGAEYDISIHMVEAFLKDGHLVSSSVIRRQVTDGNVELAKLLLGRPYFIEGKVVTGDGMGRQLGFPTANLKTNNELLPARGVYATRTHIGDRRYKSVTNIGIRPTFKGNDLRIETHLLNFNRKITGRSIKVEFLKRIRAEKTFKSPQELVAQIKKDIARV